MRHHNRFNSLTPLLVFAFAATASAQLQTIPEMLRSAGESMSSSRTIPSGVPPTLDQILSETDTIVRGVVGQPRSYLSEDERNVYTDYPLVNPTFLYQASLGASGKLEMPTMTVTILGGTITMNGLSFTSKHEALASLEPGAEGLFLLKKVGNRYHLAGIYLGAFGITEGKLMPLTKRQGFATELRGALATEAAAEMVARTSTLRTPGR